MRMRRKRHQDQGRGPGYKAAEMLQLPTFVLTGAEGEPSWPPGVLPSAQQRLPKAMTAREAAHERRLEAKGGAETYLRTPQR